MEKEKRFAIIGAGAAGLCAAKHLLAHGIPVTIFEAGSKIGGLWVYNNDSGLSSAYRSLHINSEARVSSYNDFPFPEDGPLYPDHSEMQRYFGAYADRFGLRQCRRRRSSVLSRWRRLGSRRHSSPLHSHLEFCAGGWWRAYAIGPCPGCRRQ